MNGRPEQQVRLFDAKPYVGPKTTPAYQKEWRLKNPERVKQYEDARRGKRRKYKNEWAKRNPARIAASEMRRVLKRYGLTVDGYNQLVTGQKGLCAVCQRPPDVRRSPKGKPYWRLVVDHCHATGKVRALLCSSCNGLLGLARDSINVLEQAIEYIRRHQ